MTDVRAILERGVGSATPPPDGFERMLRRRDRKQRNVRIRAGVLGMTIFVAAIGIAMTGGRADQRSLTPAGTEPTVAPEYPGRAGTYATKLTIHASSANICLTCGEREVRFTGHLRSSRAACVAHSRVRLVWVGVSVWSKTKTDAEGRYAFEINPPASGHWRVRFPGKVLAAVDPHNHGCEGSASPKLSVFVGG